MSRLFLAGATGLVGGLVLQKALADPRATQVFAPTRRPLASHRKLQNQVIDFEDLSPNTETLWQCDAAICALGTTRKKAGSAKRFREIDFDIPLHLAKNLREAGCQSFALVSSLGANPKAHTLYPRVKGELEAAIAALTFPSLTIVRPGLLGGEREESRPAESLAKLLLGLLRPILPVRYRMTDPGTLANCLLRSAIEQQPGKHTIEAENIT